MGETPGTHTKEQTFCATMQSKTSQPEIQESTEMPEDAKEKLSSLPVKRPNLTTAQRKAAIQAKLLERGEAFDPAKFKRGKKKKNKKPRMGETPGSNATGETSCSANKTEMSRPESTKKDEKSSSSSYRKENKEGKLCPPGTGEQEPKVYGGVGGGEPGNEEKKKNEEKKTRDAAKRWKERSSDSHSLHSWRDHHSSSQQRSSRQVFSLSKIKEEKERLRSRERTRDSRDEERRKRLEAQKRNEMKEEAARLERERMLLNREKEKIEQDRAELLRMERERQKLEMERLQREREELEQQQLNTLRKLEEERRGTKRMADDIYAHDSHTEWQRTESYDGKRSGSSNPRSAKEPRRTESHRSSYNLPTQPTPTGGCSSRYHDDYRSSTRGETHDFRSSTRGETHYYRSSTRGDTHDYRSSTRGDTHDYRSASSSGGDSRLVAPSRPSPWSRDDYRSSNEDHRYDTGGKGDEDRNRERGGGSSSWLSGGVMNGGAVNRGGAGVIAGGQSSWGGGGDRNLNPAAASWSRTVTTNDRWIASDLMVRQAPMSSNVSYGQPPMSGSMAPNIISPMASMGNDMFEAYKQPFGRKF